MRPSDATKMLNRLKWIPGENFRKRSAEEQAKIRKATLALARAGRTYEPPKLDESLEGSENA